LIISNLDANGFHRLPPDSLVPPEKHKRLLEMVAVVQTLDPPGIAVADFRQSLILQARLDNLAPDDLERFSRLVELHLEQMRANKTKEVAKELLISEEELATLYQYLKSLDPHPGLQYSNSEIQYAIPDLVVRIVDGHLQMHLNSEAVPTLSIDPEFANLAADPRDSSYKETAAYIGNAVKSANLLISQVRMRSDTIKKIGLQLLKFQHEFFIKGPRFLKPLTYRTIAEELSLHETTVSRAVQGKYIDTDWGILPIKELFSSAVQTTDPAGEDLSKRAVMDLLKEIIAENKTGKPLSDQKLADMLAERGIKIARRTVSKYRQALNIDSSYIRS
jgi:RNA polymerase sigma-54 factor